LYKCSKSRFNEHCGGSPGWDIVTRNAQAFSVQLIPPGSLARQVGPAASEIYALYFKGKLVYVGKASKGTTKSKRTLRDRLTEHVGKIGERQNITLKDMQCRYLTFESEWWVFAAEFALMTHYEPEWNASGFGSKVPGVGRPGTHRVSRWNELFPERKGSGSSRSVREE
jgi:hypothetical protein